MPQDYPVLEKREVKRCLNEPDNGDLNPPIPIQWSLYQIVPTPLAICDHSGDIIFYNQVFLKTFGNPEETGAERITLCRLLSCRNEGVANSHCQTCPVLSRTAQGFIQSGNDGAEVRIAANEFPWAGREYRIFTLQKSENLDELKITEATFYHDISNSISLLKGYTDLLPESDRETLQEIAGPIRFLTEKIAEEVEVQKKLLLGKEDNRDLTWQALNSKDFLAETLSKLFPPDDPRVNHLVMDECSQSVAFISEPSILRRALINLLLNALEANRGKDVVQVGCYETLDSVLFSVHNMQTIPAAIRGDVLKRRVTEKNSGRGMGLYGTRIMVEKYLKGRISLESDPRNGTTVHVELPVEPF
ncbi:MAG: hypothetical protein Kow0037_09880 [Calditrichia bacterium]